MTLHVIEPTLADPTGHCFSFVESLLEAGRDRGVACHVWMARRAGPLLAARPECVEHRHFRRRLRKLQAWRLYGRLLARGEPILIATATATDLLLLDLAARRSIDRPGRVFAYVHWMRPSARHRRLLGRIGRRHPGLEILGPTESVREAFEAAGCARVRVVPYPRSPVAPPERPIPDRPAHLLYAGAARADKGFPVVVELVRALAAEGSDLPVTVQCSPTHRGRHPGEVAQAIAQLRASGHRHLRAIDGTLLPEEYRRLFEDAITVQPYDPRDFADRVSGVALDALGAGSPLVVPVGTWMARQIAPFDAGVAVRDARDAAELRAAVERVAAEWPRYARNAREAGRHLAAHHDARHLWEAVAGGERPAAVP